MPDIFDHLIGKKLLVFQKIRNVVETLFDCIEGMDLILGSQHVCEQDLQSQGLNSHDGAKLIAVGDDTGCDEKEVEHM